MRSDVDLYVSAELQVWGAPKGDFGNDVVFGYEDNIFYGRKLDGAWLAWLRKHHRGDKQAVQNFKQLVQEKFSHLSKLNLTIPPSYITPEDRNGWVLEVLRDD